MSVKSLDREGRWRDTTVGFRVSEEENERINQLAALSGMTKQAFIINRLEGNEITVLATVRVQKALAKDAVVRLEELGAVKRIFRNVECGSGMMGNVMFIAIDPKRIAELTYPEQNTWPDPMTKKRHSYDGRTSLRAPL